MHCHYRISAEKPLSKALNLSPKTKTGFLCLNGESVIKIEPDFMQNACLGMIGQTRTVRGNHGCAEAKMGDEKHGSAKTKLINKQQISSQKQDRTIDDKQVPCELKMV